MKQFRCADIVPGCSAVVKMRKRDDVVATALGHLASVHSLSETPDLVRQVRAGVANLNPLVTMFSRA